MRRSVPARLRTIAAEARQTPRPAVLLDVAIGLENELLGYRLARELRRAWPGARIARAVTIEEGVRTAAMGRASILIYSRKVGPAVANCLGDALPETSLLEVSDWNDPAKVTRIILEHATAGSCA